MCTIFGITLFPRHSLRQKMYLSVRISLLLLFIFILRSCLGQGSRNGPRDENEVSAADHEIRFLDETVMTTLLRVVDHKFDTLSSRLSALERAINGLQYYSIRQFRMMQSTTKAINHQMKDVNTRMAGIEIEVTRGDLSTIRRHVGEVRNDVKVMKRTSDGMFEAIEHNIQRVDDRVKNNFDIVQNILGFVDHVDVNTSVDHTEVFIDKVNVTEYILVNDTQDEEGIIIESSGELFENLTDGGIDMNNTRTLDNINVLSATGRETYFCLPCNCSGNFNEDKLTMTVESAINKSIANLQDRMSQVVNFVEDRLDPYRNQTSVVADSNIDFLNQVFSQTIQNSEKLNETLTKISQLEGLISNSSTCSPTDVNPKSDLSTNITHMEYMLEDLLNKTLHPTNQNLAVIESDNVDDKNESDNITHIMEDIQHDIGEIILKQNAIAESSRTTSHILKIIEDRQTEVGSETTRTQQEIANQHSNMISQISEDLSTESATQKEYIQSMISQILKLNEDQQTEAARQTKMIGRILKISEDRQSEFGTMDLLSMMDAKLSETLTYNRYSGNIMEQIHTMVESVTVQQARMYENVDKLQHWLAGSINNITKRIHRTGNDIPRKGRPKPEMEVLVKQCQVPIGLFKDLETLAANGTGLIRIIGDLAQLSTISISTAILEIGRIVERMHEVEDQINARPQGYLLKEDYVDILNTTMDSFRIFSAQDFEFVSNLTIGTFNIAEAVSTNTGWIPFMLDAIDFIGKTENQSLQTTNSILEKVNERISVVVKSEAPLYPRGWTADSNRKGNSGTCTLQMGGTMQSLQKILPSVTRWLNQAAPMFTLVNGSNYNEGRVEFYKDGIWGSICSAGMGDDQATLLCKLIGYSAGLVANDHKFGSGTGPVWHLKPECLSHYVSRINSQYCLTNGIEANSCEPQQTLGVICDHMVRMVNKSVPWAGMVEVYHEGSWGSICYSGWTNSNADVVCKQLGYRVGEATDAGPINAAIGPVWLSDVVCTGDETHLHLCGNVRWRRNTCVGNHLAGVQCSK